MMTRRGNGQPILHGNLLRPSRPDDAGLAEAVEVRFLRLCTEWQNMRREPLAPPPGLMPDMLRWRTMRMRHKAGHLYHTDAEMGSTRAVAEWTYEMIRELRGQKDQPRPKLPWE